MSTNGNPPSSTEYINNNPSSFVPKPTTTIQNFLPQFWSHVIHQAEQYQSDFKDGQLPLARIKKLVKSDPDIKMIANEVTVLLDKACEIFINEITVRSFLVANSYNRRTVNTSDVAQAISQSDMFDFLIDIVPNEPVISTENNNSYNSVPSTSTATNVTTTATSTSATTTTKKKQPSNFQALDQSESSSQLPISVPTTKKKSKKNKVNQNLLPEEIAVPIPDEELIQPFNKKQFKGSIEHNLRSDKRLLAIPIPDSELIPPKSAEPSWEMAVPITSNLPISSSMAPPPVPKRSWELAVPISDSNSSNWEMAVPINDHNPSNYSTGLSFNPTVKRKLNWDLAVPIIDDENQSNNLTDLNKLKDIFNHSSASSSSSSILKHNQIQQKSSYLKRNQNQNNNTNTNRTWELAVPVIEDDNNNNNNNHHHQSNQYQVELTNNQTNNNLFNQHVPIDPSLLSHISSVKVEPDLIHPNPNSNPLLNSFSFLESHSLPLTFTSTLPDDQLVPHSPPLPLPPPPIYDHLNVKKED